MLAALLYHGKKLGRHRLMGDGYLPACGWGRCRHFRPDQHRNPPSSQGKRPQTFECPQNRCIRKLPRPQAEAPPPPNTALFWECWHGEKTICPRMPCPELSQRPPPEAICPGGSLGHPWNRVRARPTGRKPCRSCGKKRARKIGFLARITVRQSPTGERTVRRPPCRCKGGCLREHQPPGCCSTQ